MYTKLIRREMKEHYNHLKGNIHQEDIALLNIYALNTRANMSVKETPLQFKSHTGPNIKIANDIHTHSSQ